jgi:hypothetical protein
MVKTLLVRSTAAPRISNHDPTTSGCDETRIGADVDGTRSGGSDCLAESYQEAIMSNHWPASTERFDITRGTSEDTAAYAAGWTVSGLATLATILAVWVFAI